MLIRAVVVQAMMRHREAIVVRGGVRVGLIARAAVKGAYRRLTLQQTVCPQQQILTAPNRIRTTCNHLNSVVMARATTITTGVGAVVGVVRAAAVSGPIPIPGLRNRQPVLGAMRGEIPVSRDKSAATTGATVLKKAAVQPNPTP